MDLSFSFNLALAASFLRGDLHCFDLFAAEFSLEKFRRELNYFCVLVAS
jgi:hypothetical protein